MQYDTQQNTGLTPNSEISVFYRLEIEPIYTEIDRIWYSCHTLRVSLFGTDLGDACVVGGLVIAIQGS